MPSEPRVLGKLRKLCLALPDAKEQTSHGEPAFFVKKRMFATFANADTHHGRGRHGVWTNSPTSCATRTRWRPRPPAKNGVDQTSCGAGLQPCVLAALGHSRDATTG